MARDPSPRPKVPRSLASRAWLFAAIHLSAGIALIGPACRARYGVCDQHLERCSDSADVGGTSGFGGTVAAQASSGGRDAQAEGGAASGGEESIGSAGFGGDLSGAATVGKLGQPCEEEGARSCRSRASRFRLVCEGGVWASAGQCRWDERCESEGEATGTCQTVVPECLDREPGEWLCRNEGERFRCGPDLLDDDESEICESGCRDGRCRACVPGEVTACSWNGLVTCSDAETWIVVPCPRETPYCTGGACGVPPSCAEPSASCGLGGAVAPCCSSALVEGGSFQRENDPERPATVSSFRLDAFEVTVARFNRFAAAWANGFRPDPGAGKHVHLNAGLGLRLASDGEAFEAGWDPAWDAAIDLSEATRTNNDDPYSTWSHGSSSLYPLNFVSYYEALAFCTWDGGFLPSAAEWSFAASGGSMQLPFPWGDEEPEADAELSVHDCWFYGGGTCAAGLRDIAQVGAVPAGIGLFGQLDLAGNLAERVQGGLDAPGSCDDCLERPTLPAVTVDQVRGGAFDSNAEALANDVSPIPILARGTRSAQVGFRCARPP